MLLVLGRFIRIGSANRDDTQFVTTSIFGHMTVDSDKVLVAIYNKTGANWWMISSIVTAGITIIALAIWLTFRTRPS
jgi:hypothetical protein